MTERRSAALWVVAAAGAVFAVVLDLPRAADARGRRPGARRRRARGRHAAAEPRPVLIRKVIVRRVIEEAAAPAAARRPRRRPRRPPRPAPAAASAPAAAAARARAAAPAPGPGPGARHHGGVVILSLRVDETFRALGTDVRLLVSAPDAPRARRGARAS